MTDDPIYEPKCPVCKRFDANCTCDWPMPAGAPTTPPDDEALTDWPGYRFTSLTPEEWAEAQGDDA